MARDFFIRPDLQKIGLPERTIRVLEKVSLLIEALERLNTTEGQITDINTATDALNEAIEDANLTLAALDARLDDQENGNGPYVKKTGDTMSGPLNVNALLECDTFKINVSPTAETVVCTHTITIAVGATNYKIPLVAA
jgi:hypothetical protein